MLEVHAQVARLTQRPLPRVGRLTQRLLLFASLPTQAKMASINKVPPIPVFAGDFVDINEQQSEESVISSPEESEIDLIEIAQSQADHAMSSATVDTSSSLDKYYKNVMSKFQEFLNYFGTWVKRKEVKEGRDSWTLLANALVDIRTWAYQCSDNEETFIRYLPLISHHWQVKLRSRFAALELGLNQFNTVVEALLQFEDLNESLRQNLYDHCSSILRITKRLVATKSNLKLVMSAVRMTMASTQELPSSVPQAPLVLCLDGGGIRTYSSLLILRALMSKISSILDESKQSNAERHDVQKPCDVFECVYGSSSGGLAAIMLGRLEMSVEETIQRFLTYATKVFSEFRKRRTLTRLFSNSKYSEKTIIDATRRLVKEYDPVPDHLKWRRNNFLAPELKCKTGVIAFSLASEAIPLRMFRSYESAEQIEHQMTPTSVNVLTSMPEVWEVARATSAVPFMFPPQLIDGKRYVDGGLGANNPTLAAFREIETFGMSLEDSCIVSIGCGLSLAPRRKHHLVLGGFRDAIDDFRALATHTQNIEAQAHSIAAMTKGCEYFRFDPIYDRQIDLDELGSEAYMAAAVEAYLNHADIQNSLRRCANLVVSKMKNKDKPRVEHEFFMVPYRISSNFVGRHEEFTRLEKRLQKEKAEDQISPKIFVITGLTGLGKTELCAQFAYRMRQKYWGIFWIDASSSHAAEAGFERVMNLLGFEFKGREIAVQVLSNIRRKWLLILDAVDDLETNYEKFIPSALYGTIIINSRNPSCNHLSTAGTLRLEVLPTSELTNLFWSVSGLPGDPGIGDLIAIHKLLELIGQHTLATIIAARFISQRRITIPEAVLLFEHQPDSILQYQSHYVKPHYDSISAIFEITIADFQQQNEVGKHALELLHMLSMLQDGEIPLKIFDATNQVLHYPGNSSDTATVSMTKEVLSDNMDLVPFLREGKMDRDGFVEGLELLEAHSLVRVTSSNISMHPLVRRWALERQDPSVRVNSWFKMALILILSHFQPSVQTTQQTQSHFKILLDNTELDKASFDATVESLAIMLAYGRVLVHVGAFSELDTLLTIIAHKFNLSRADPDTSNALFYNLCIDHSRMSQKDSTS